MTEFDPAEARAFLKRFKRAIRDGGFSLFEDYQSLIDLGFTRKNCQNEILALTVEDYCEGPIPDLDRPGTVWIFGTTVRGQEVYIKLKLLDLGDTVIAKCLSFHIADRPQTYPFRGKAE